MRSEITSITSEGLAQSRVDAALPFNPHIRYWVGVRRTRLESCAGVGEHGVHQATRWTPWKTPRGLVVGATVLS